MENLATQATAAPTPGAVLADARRRNGLSVGDIAAKLRMGIPQVDALEHADYARLPTGTFLRGFVRSYAKLVGLDPNEILLLLEQTHNTNPKPTIVVPSHNIRFTAPGEQFSSPRARIGLLVIFIAAVMAAGWYWWTFMRQGAQSAQPSPVAAQTNTATPNTDTALLSGGPGSATPAPGAEAKDPVTGLPVPTGLENASIAVQQPATQSAALDAVQPAAQSASQPAPPLAAPALAQVAAPADSAVPAKSTAAAGLSRLHFAFSGESWVEVLDGSGRAIASRRYRAGEGEDVNGKPPLTVVIGNAPATRVTVNGTDFDLLPYTRVSVARFTLK